MRSLQLTEARERFQLLEVTSYDVTLDLAVDGKTFPSRTRIDFSSGAGETFLDLKALEVLSVHLDGTALDTARWADGRFPLDLSSGAHLLEVDAVMGFRNDGEGLHRSTDPADGRDYVYGMSFMSAAPSVFACFDQPDLKAPYTLHVTAPPEWLVRANAAGVESEPGRWEFETSQPLSTYFVTVVAGPYHQVEAEHDGIPLGLLCRHSLAADLDKDADELFTITRQCFDEFHRLFEVRYPFGKYDQAFVPEFNAGAMENPGCVTFRDPLIFSSRVSRSQRIRRATTISHEMAHQWFGNLVTPRWWDDLWLNEAFAEYLGNRVAAEVTEFTDALEWASITRKNWGLTADSRPSTHAVAGNGATDADAALQNFDGISYAKGHAMLAQLAARIGDRVFFDGARDHFARHRFGNATMSDLFASWEGAGAGDLSAWTDAWLRTAGLDRIELDRAAGGLVRTPPSEHPADRTHALGIAQWDGAGWQRSEVVTTGNRTPIDVGGRPVVLDPDDTSWADLTLDPVTAHAMPDLLPRTGDPTFRAAVWNTVRNGVLQARLDPAGAVDILCAGIPQEAQDAAVVALGDWVADAGTGSRSTVHEKLLPVVTDRDASRSRLHAAFLERANTAPAGSELQLAAFVAAVGTCPDPDSLRTVLDGAPPTGITLDVDLRWRILKRLTAIGATDLEELDHELGRLRDSVAQLGHAWCHARLPDASAKQWAWDRFTGTAAASNYEIEAIGSGMWDPDQAEVLAPYVERYLAEVAATTRVRSGWVLAEAARFFYPITAFSPELLHRTEALAASDLDPALARTLGDVADVVRRRLAVQESFR